MNQTVLLKTKRKIKYTYAFFIVLLVLVVISLFVSNSFSELLENDVEVKKDTELTYYLTVSYDGVDKNGVQSNDTTVSLINSGVLFIEDKIPEGLTFKGFVTTADGSIGAVERGTTTACVGKVIDDTNEVTNDAGVWNGTHTEFTYHGLHYDDTTRVVSFKVKNLQAGCDLTVGVITQTPATIDDPNTVEQEVRRDFYNFATARERELVANSNTVHAFMGSEFETLHNVTYQYTGTVPSNAPSVPITTSYAEGANVGVANNVTLEGYTFSGWSSNDVTVSNGSFTMGSSDVVFTGSFTAVPTNTVTYAITGTTPPGYVLPSDVDYVPGAVVTADSLEVGSVINGYKFLGWTSNDVTLSSDNDFIMPNSNVTLNGSFAAATYSVSYQFYDSVLPPNAENYLPATATYSAGDTVTLSNVVSEPTGYKFLGWYKENSFVMPEEDVVVYGEWRVQNGTFTLGITNNISYIVSNQVVPSKSYYKTGDILQYTIVVTNNESYQVDDVYVKTNLDEATFISDNAYTIESDHIAKISSIPANSSTNLYIRFSVSDNDFGDVFENGTVSNKVEIVSATAANDYYLTDQEVSATASFQLAARISVCKEVSGIDINRTYQILVEQIDTTAQGYTTVSEYLKTPIEPEYWIVLEKDICKDVFIEPSNVLVREIVPQEFSVRVYLNETSVGNMRLTEMVAGGYYEYLFTNTFNKKGFFHSFGRAVNDINAHS